MYFCSFAPELISCRVPKHLTVAAWNRAELYSIS